jgi:hypothetical protein
MQSARLAGRLFSAKDREGRQAGEAIIESFDEPFEDTVSRTIRLSRLRAQIHLRRQGT